MAARRSTRALLRDLETLTHSERAARVASLARDSDSRSLETLLGALDGDVYLTRLRLLAATVAGRDDHLWAGLDHPSSAVRGAALHGLLANDLDQDRLVALLAVSSKADRSRIARHLRQHRLQALADGVIDHVRERFGDADAARFLPATSPAVATRLLPDLAHTIRAWGSMAHHHPDTVVAYLDDQLAVNGAVAAMTRQHCWRAIAQLAETRPAALLEQWGRFPPPSGTAGTTNRRVVRNLLAFDADRTIELACRDLEPRALQTFTMAMGRRIQAADDETIGKLLHRVRAHQSTVAGALRKLAPSRRGRVFDLAFEGVDRASLILSDELLTALPFRMREAEAERMSGLVTRPDALLRLAPHLPAERGDALIADEISSADADRRAAGYRAVVVAAFSRPATDAIDDLFVRLARTTNERDPVRLSIAQSLAQQSVPMVHARHLAAIADLVRASTQARDTSAMTARGLGTFLERLLMSTGSPGRVDMAEPVVDAIVELHRRFGRFPMSSWRRVSKASADLLSRRLEVRLRADLRADRFELLFSLIAALGHTPILDDLLDVVIRSAKTDAAERAIGLWLAEPTHRLQRAVALVERDASTVHVRPVHQALAAAGHPLLRDAISGRRPAGRFAPSVGGIVHVDTRWVGRWTTEQQRTYAQALVPAARNEHTSWHKYGAIRALGRLQDPEALERLVAIIDHNRSEGGDVVAVEGALAALGDLDAPGPAQAVLIRHLGTERARVAAPALRGTARRMPSDQRLTDVLAAPLSDASTKLVARKTIVELLGSLSSIGSPRALSALWERRPLHPDLAATLARVAHDRPADPLGLEVLESLALGREDDALLLCQLRPIDWPERLRPSVAATVAQALDHPSERVAQQAWHGTSIWATWAPSIADRLVDTTADLERDWTPHLALGELAAAVRHRVVPDALDRVVDRLTAAAEPPTRSIDQRDLPVRTRLEEIVRRFDGHEAHERDTLRRVSERLVDTGYGSEAVRYASRSIDPADPQEGLARLRAIVAEAPASAPVLVDDLPHRLGAKVGLDLEALAEAAERLAHTPDGAVVALAATVHGGRATGWSPAWCSVLELLRGHRDPWIQGHAILLRVR